MIDTAALAERFRSLYGQGPVRMFAAPGRVNLIGEHTDYSEGFVLPIAIERQTVVAARARGDQRLRAASLREGGTPVAVALDAPRGGKRPSWMDYVEGVARTLAERGLALSGADLLVDSDVPYGAGLSSSAALEMAVGLALTALSGTSVDRIALALAGQAAEHTYAGTRCGIMDQYIVALGRRGQALLIDCRSLEATPVTFGSSDVALVVCDSKVKHTLASSAYNERRAECEAAVERLRSVVPDARTLRDINLAHLDEHAALLSGTLLRRARHVVGENARTLEAAAALREGDLERTGALMYASHASLRDDYEVSAPELDVLVEAARGVPGVYGSRMTGGGFGGCTVTLVAPSAVEPLSAALSAAYGARFGRAPELFVTRAADGVRELG